MGVLRWLSQYQKPPDSSQSTHHSSTRTQLPNTEGLTMVGLRGSLRQYDIVWPQNKDVVPDLAHARGPLQLGDYKKRKVGALNSALETERSFLKLEFRF